MTAVQKDKEGWSWHRLTDKLLKIGILYSVGSDDEVVDG
jgi:hypothetical protein